jgi:hypothetical protein
MVSNSMAAAMARVRGFEPSTLWIVWVVLVLYALPLLGTFVTLVSADPGLETGAIYIVGTITKQFAGTLRDTFGVIVVPLLTAFAIKSIAAEGTVPGRTLLIFLGVSGLFVLSILTSGMLGMHHYRLGIKRHNPEIYDTLVNATQTYSKELLTYIALTIGISLKKS